MRFDDRLNTVLAGRIDSDSGREAMWRQLLDLIAQQGSTLAEPLAKRAFQALSMLQPHVRPAARRAALTAAASRTAYAPLAAYAAQESPDVAFNIFGRIQLADADWLPLIGSIGPVARSAMRQRHDLSPTVATALAGYAAGDFALPAPEGRSEQDRIEIRDLVRRIEEYRIRREAGTTSGEDDVVAMFVTDDQGVIINASGAVSRGRLVGLDISQPAVSGEAGCDAAVARLFSKRGAIQNGRMQLRAQDAALLYFLCDAEPQFARNDGRFMGYAGTLRPARMAAELQQNQSPAETSSSDLVRQMMHELRSPLNAMSGFAELIEGQYFGPAPHRYRSLATAIVNDTRRLLMAVEELDALARLDAPANAPADQQAIYLTNIAVPGLSRLADLLQRTGRQLLWEASGAPSPLAINEAQGQRLISLLVSGIAAFVDRGESLNVRLLEADGRIEISLPAAMAGLTWSDLVAHDSITPDADEPEEAGLGFSFLIADRMAAAAGCDIGLANGQCFLNLPSARPVRRQG